MNFTTCTAHIVGTAPMSQSRKHEEPKLAGERDDPYNKRTWRSHLNLSPSTGTVIIPRHGMHQALIAAAKFSGKSIPGQGKKTWTAKLTSGIAILTDIDTGIDPATVQPITINANSDGVRGSGKRVTRTYPLIDEGWTAAVEIVVLDPILTEDVMRDMLELAGMFIGIGRFRPEKGGQNGRFALDRLDWQDRRAEVA